VRLLAPIALALAALVSPGLAHGWPAPSLDGDVRVIHVPPSGGDWYGIPTNQDCEVRMPRRPVGHMVKVHGCHDIRLIGGEVTSSVDPCGSQANGREDSVGIYLTQFSGVAHVERVRVHGRGLSDGIWLSSTLPGSVGQLQRSSFWGFAACTEPAPSGSPWPDEHPNCFQTWAGPSILRFDRLACWTILEGFNLDTNNQVGPDGRRFPAAVIDVRRTAVHLDERSPNGRQCFEAWSVYSPAPTRVADTWCAPGSQDFAAAFAPTLFSDRSWWGGVKRGSPRPRLDVAPRQPARRAARAGVPLRVDCWDACRVVARLRAKGRTLARMGARSGVPGRVRLRLRLRHAPPRRARLLATVAHQRGRDARLVRRIAFRR
jgi:hypothetical protein